MGADPIAGLNAWSNLANARACGYVGQWDCAGRKTQTRWREPQLFGGGRMDAAGRSGAEVREEAKRWAFPLFASRR
jgi:hypothetical protein